MDISQRPSGKIGTAALRQVELGGFLRSRREKLAPDSQGLGTGRKRRTPGLRREEVAERAGIGVDWYIRLEQGRSGRPSAITVDALAKALRLNQLEHGHLRSLAKNTDCTAFSRETVPATILRMVQSLNLPAYVTGRRWDLLAWNTAAKEALTDFEDVAQEDRNILLYMFTASEAKQLFGQAWAVEARRMLASFRTVYDVWAGAAPFEELLEKLKRKSPEFERWWELHELASNSGVKKVLHRPGKTQVSFDVTSFQSNEDAALRITIYTPA